MSCNCPGAPHTSGPFQENRQKLAAEVIRVSAPWCAELEDDGEILFSQWTATPTDVDTQLVISDESIDETITSASVAAGTSGVLFQLQNEVQLKRTAESPTETLIFTFWIFVNGSSGSCDDGCGPSTSSPCGTQGPQGAQGEPGVQGAQGAAGDDGAQGAQGAQGAAGNNGLTGPQGVPGSQGPQGFVGLTGAQGPRGFAGSQGAQGTQGPQGLIGATGAQGSTGAQGTTGSDGPQGD